MFYQDGLTGSAWGDWANYADSPLRADAADFSKDVGSLRGCHGVTPLVGMGPSRILKVYVVFFTFQNKSIMTITTGR